MATVIRPMHHPCESRIKFLALGLDLVETHKHLEDENLLFLIAYSLVK